MMPEELRTAYHRQLDEIDSHLTRMIVLVEESVAGAEAAFVGLEDAAADRVAANVAAIEEGHRAVESMILSQFVRQAPVAGELRFLVGALRIVPEVELTAALASNLATFGYQHLASELSPRVRGLVCELFDQSSAMWRRANDAYADRGSASAAAIAALRRGDLSTSLRSELTTSGLRAPSLMDMALVARFLDRIGDHAVEVGRWFDSFSGA
jgi:phosphate transport system protein